MGKTYHSGADSESSGNLPPQYSWNNALRIIKEIAAGVKTATVVFDEKHTHDLHTRWEKDPVGFFSILDQIHEKFMQTNWDAVRDIARYIQWHINKTTPQTSLSPFILSFLCSSSSSSSSSSPSNITPPSRGINSPPEVLCDSAGNSSNNGVQCTSFDNQSFSNEMRLCANIESNLNDNVPSLYETPLWDDIVNFILPHIEMSLTQSVGILIKFGEMHKSDLKQLLDINPDEFWWILDRIHEKLKSSDWSCVTDDAHFIQECIRNVATQKYGIFDSGSSLFPPFSSSSVGMAPFHDNEYTDELSPFMQELIVAMHEEKMTNSH